MTVRRAGRPADGRPLVFAHRGGCAVGPENTLVAFDRGLALGADGLELDVHLSRDGIVVVHHDARLDRTTDASGPIAARTADDLAGVDAAFHFRPEEGYPWRGRGIGIPRLADVVSRYRDVPLIIEMKANSETLACRTIEIVRRAGAIDHVWLGSFRLRPLRAARAGEPRIPTGAAREETRWALYRSWVGWPVRRPPYRVFQVPEHFGRTRVVSPRFIRAAHAAGLPVHVWTINDAADMRRLLDWGADALITDEPALAVETVRTWMADARNAVAHAARGRRPEGTKMPAQGERGE